MAPRKGAWLALAVALSLSLTACGSKPTAPSTGDTGTATKDSGKPKSLTIGMWSSPGIFNPLTYTTTYDSTVISLIYPRLLVMNDKLDFIPSLADTFTANDTQDKFTFKLNPKAKWSDGTPITADDVAYTMAAIANPAVQTTRRSLIDTIKGLDDNGINPKAADMKIDGIKVVDATTIEFSTKTPVDKDAFFEKVGTSIYIQPKSVLSKVTDWKSVDTLDWAKKPQVTGGAYKFVDYKTDSYVELAPNPDYFLGAPKLAKLFIKIVTQASMAAAVEKGEIDVPGGAGVGEIPITDWDKISKLASVTPVTYVAQSYQYLDINHKVFGNVKVRQAIAYAINRPLIVSRLLKGQGEVMNTPLNSANKYYSKDLQTEYAYNKDKAKQLLTEGGWDFNKEVVLLTPTGNAVREQSADIIQQNLQDAGMKVKIEKVDFPTRQARAKKGDFELSLVGFSANFDPDFSSQVMTGGGFNYSFYANKTMDATLTKGKQIVKFDEKKTVYQEAQKQFVADVPFLPLYSPKSLTVVNKRVQNIKLGPNGLTWNAQEWDVK
jgi:peptide/nickel transport system substrate-binding protein